LALEKEAPEIPAVVMGEFKMRFGFFCAILVGKIYDTSEFDLNLPVTLLPFRKFMLKLKEGTRGIFGICGILKLDLLCMESLIALTRELT
jgi:hypothetical protein